MTELLLNSTALRKTLVIRFAAAIVLALLTTIGAFAAVHWQLKQNEQDGYLINISGRQRMLSQRIALLSGKCLQADNAAEQKAARDRLHLAMQRMRKEHQTLHTSGSLGQFPLRRRLDAQIKAFLSTATEISGKVAKGADASEQYAALLQASADSTLLPNLDARVAYLEHAYDQKLVRFKSALLLLAVGCVIALAAVCWWIFKPTVELVSTNLLHLEESNAELTEFSYRISHDLRAPVVAALGISEVVKDALDDGEVEVASMSLDRVLHSLKRVSVTIEDIVSLIKQKMSSVAAESFRIRDVVDEALETVGNMPDYDQVEVSVDCPEECTVSAKRVYLKQTLENLISNAVKYRDPEASPSRIHVSVKQQGKEWMVSVEDNGLGIDKPYREKMFNMFQRFHPTVSFGTGLGLYLVSKNAAALGGSINYQPMDRGSRFDVNFPTLGA